MRFGSKIGTGKKGKTITLPWLKHQGPKKKAIGSALPWLKNQGP